MRVDLDSRLVRYKILVPFADDANYVGDTALARVANGFHATALSLSRMLCHTRSPSQTHFLRANKRAER